MKYIKGVFLLIIFFWCVLRIDNSTISFLQNSLNLNYSLANLLTYIFMIIIFLLIYIFFEKEQKNNENEINNLLHLTYTINHFDYSKLKKIKELYINSKSSFTIIFKNDSKISLNISSIPKNQHDLELLDFDLSLGR